MHAMRDTDSVETQEWLDALAAVRAPRGLARANLLVNPVVEAAQRDRIYAPQSLTTPYCNTIPAQQQPDLPGDRATEHRLTDRIKLVPASSSRGSSTAGDNMRKSTANVHQCQNWRRMARASMDAINEGGTRDGNAASSEDSTFLLSAWYAWGEPLAAEARQFVG
jgi:hypothetical protein